MRAILPFDWKIYFYRNSCDIDFIHVIEEISNVTVARDEEGFFKKRKTYMYNSIYVSGLIKIVNPMQCHTLCSTGH